MLHNATLPLVSRRRQRRLDLKARFRRRAPEFRRVRVEADRGGIMEHFRSTGEVVPGTTVIADRRYLRIF